MLNVETIQTSYTPGSFAKDLASSSHALDTFGCVDVALSLATDDDGTSLEWRMGNRCDRLVETDTSALVVTAIVPGEAETRVALADPELGPRDLEPRQTAFDRIALSLPAGTERVCVTYLNVVSKAAARGRQPACFEWQRGWVLARDRA
jgi:hypothetical protein